MKTYQSMEDIKPLISDNKLTFTEDIEITFDFSDFNIQIESKFNVSFLKSCSVKSLEVGGSLKVGEWLNVDGSLKVGRWLKVGGWLNVGEWLEVSGSLNVDGSLKVGGWLNVSEWLEVSGSLNVSGWLEVDGTLNVSGWLEVDGTLKVGRWLKVGGSLKVGGTITAQSVFSGWFLIKCKSLKTTQLPFWRDYWSEMPPLKKWKDKIINVNYCWNDLKAQATEAEKQEIVSWEGWHWILKAQLEMYLGLKQEVIF